jgi:hypothetical protein
MNSASASIRSRLQCRQPAIDEQDRHQKLTRGDARISLIVEQSPAKDRQHDHDQRDRDCIEQHVGEPLRRDEIDVDIAENEQERPP